MRFIVNTKNFIHGIRLAEHVAGRNVSLPILSTILISTDKGRVKISATNLEIGVHYWVSSKIEKEGSVAIPARTFSEFISMVSDEKITLSSQKETLTITSESYKTTVLGMKPDEFPPTPSVRTENQLSAKASDFRGGLLHVMDAASSSETRPELSGVYMTTTSKSAIFAATDSFRLAENTITLSQGGQTACILPRNTASELVRILDDVEGGIVVHLSDNQMKVVGDNFELVSRLIDGRYPEYKKVIPESHQATSEIDKSELERITRMGSVFSSSIADIQIKSDHDFLTILAKNTERGEISAKVPNKLQGKPFSVSVNYRYLLDGLKTMDDDTVMLCYVGEDSPVLLFNKESSEQRYVIMPLRS